MKKLLVALTVIWGIGSGLLFINPVSINESSLFLTEKIQLSSKFLYSTLNFYTATRAWIELGMLLGAMLLGYLWTIVLIHENKEGKN